MLATALAAAWLAVVEAALLGVLRAVAPGALAWLLLATLALTILFAAPLVLVEAGLLSWTRVRRLLPRPGPAQWRWTAGLLLLLGAAGAQWVNATAYVRLYLGGHIALSAAALLAAQLGFALLLGTRAPVPGAPRPLRRRLLLALGVVAWLAALGASMAVLITRQTLRVVATDQATLLTQELLLFDAWTDAFSPTAALLRGEVPDALVAAVAPASPAPPVGVARGANLLLITVDSLRADRLPPPGQGSAPHMPNVAALAQDAVVAARAYAPSCWTIHSMTATMTSQLPSRLRFTYVSVNTALDFEAHALESALVRNPLFQKQVTPVPLHESRPTLAGILGRAGYQTATVAAYVFYLRDAGLTRDFDIVDEEDFRAGFRGGNGLIEVPMVERAAQFLDGRDAQRPFLLWLHFMEPHAPYEPRDAAAAGGSDQARYDSEVRHVDRQIGELLALLRDRGLFERTVVVVHADHGEEFGEHGGQFHASTLFDEVVHVPLVLRLPRSAGVAPAVLEAPVSLLDLGPTLLDVLGVPSQEVFMGRSLWPALAGAPATPRPVLSECFRFGRRRRALLVWPYKLIIGERLGSMQLFHLGQDPGERHNLADEMPVVLAGMLGLLGAIVETHLGDVPGHGASAVHRSAP